jgi:hypothetical protein
MFLSRARNALALGIVLGMMGGAASATTVGAEYANNDACGNDTLPNADNNAGDFYNVMGVFGYSKKFLYGNALYWPDDITSSTVSGGKDNLYGDNTNILFLESHGGSDSARFRITTGATRTIDGTSTCRAWTSNPSTGNQWWKLGDGQLRILCLLSCHSLQLEDLAHFDAAAQGIHMITGGSGNMYDSGGSGFGVAFWGGGMGQTVKQAWFGNTSADTWVVMAYGSTQADAVNRRDNERFGWAGGGRVSPTAWRAWSWVD